MSEANIDTFRQRISEYYHETIKIPAVPTLKVDFEVVKPELLTLENVAALERTEPFGNSFLPPILCIRGATLNSAVPVAGGRHTKIRIVKSGKSFDCIAFNRAIDDFSVKPGDIIDLAFEPQVNEFRGWRNVQLHIMDMRAHAE
jgi:single-stranded-DNA-specific exonuclease